MEKGMYKVGDKFINLVENESRKFSVGDILVIAHIDTDFDPHDQVLLPYNLIGEHDDIDQTDGWWYSDETINKFTIPLSSMSDEELFLFLMSGKYPDRKTYNYESDYDEAPDWAILYKHGK